MTAAFSQGCTKESRLPAEISSEAVQRYSLLLNNCKHTISDACCTFFRTTAGQKYSWWLPVSHAVNLTGSRGLLITLVSYIPCIFSIKLLMTPFIELWSFFKPCFSHCVWPSNLHCFSSVCKAIQVTWQLNCYLYFVCGVDSAVFRG